MTGRVEWKDYVKASGLPDGVKMTLVEHADRGRHHFHRDDVNEHGVTRKRLATTLRKKERTIERHMRRGEAEGLLVLHRRGHRGQQAVYHYAVPGEVLDCPDCEVGYGPRKGDISGAERATPLAPYSDPGKGDTPDAPVLIGAATGPAAATTDGAAALDRETAAHRDAVTPHPVSSQGPNPAPAETAPGPHPTATSAKTPDTYRGDTDDEPTAGRHDQIGALADATQLDHPAKEARPW